MDLDELKKQFLVDDEVVTEKLEQLLRKVLPHCVVDKKGAVHLKSSALSGKEQIRLVLAGRLIASKLDPEVSGEVTVDQLHEYTGLPKNQAAARAKECIDDKFAERSVRGSYRARMHKLEQFLDRLPAAETTQRAS